MKAPETLLDIDGYPTEEWLQFIKEYNPDNTHISVFLEALEEGWHFGSWGFKLKRKYKGVRKLELHTGGWSGNEEIINEILSNIYLSHFSMIYAKWTAGGHYYFEIKHYEK
jgi:hypothetical protein